MEFLLQFSTYVVTYTRPTAHVHWRYVAVCVLQCVAVCCSVAVTYTRTTSHANAFQLLYTVIKRPLSHQKRPPFIPRVQSHMHDSRHRVTCEWVSFALHSVMIRPLLPQKRPTFIPRVQWHMHGSRHTCEWVTSHMWMSHVTHVNESRHTCE